jgi:hypothetical protein
MMRQKKIIAAISIIFIVIWSGFVVSAYYVVQKPLALQVIDHLFSLAWTLLITSMLLLNALALGISTIRSFVANDNISHSSILLLAGGLGLGELGLLGFILAAMGAAQFLILLGVQIFFLVWFIRRGTMTEIFAWLGEFRTLMKTSGSRVPRWMTGAGIAAVILTFLMTFLPPVEAYDALLYHLTVPDLWIRDTGLRAYNIPPYWFPSLGEGAFVWGLGLGSDIVPQQLHFLWALFTALLLWDWSRNLWNDITAWWVLMFLVSMPSLPLLASWAYTDLALTFFVVATMYTLWQGHQSSNLRWWRLAAVFTGMAMGMKYTSVIIPLTAFILISIWKFREQKKWLPEILWFGMISGFTACIWYLRNWLWVGNPFYPFVFGGRYWDSFRAAWYAGAGTGVGWDLKAILSLPLTITLNYQDITAFDGDIGPLFLLSLPMALWILIRSRNLEPAQQQALTVIGLFGFFSVALWTYGYVTSRNLWQARLLFPAIIPFSIPASLGLASIQNMDTKRLRLSFVVSGLAIAAIFANLLDLSLSVISRNPFAAATGISSRESFMEKFQPEYASALELIAQTPQDANVYSLFEPRSYGAFRSIQPDTLLDNFPHDVFLYKNPEDIIRAWHTEKYTHVLVNKRGADLVLREKQSEVEILNKTISLLKPISVSPNGSYELYEIIAP